jgi:hypothetical protein
MMSEQILPHHFKDARLSSIEWRAGKYDEFVIIGGEGELDENLKWFVDLFAQADDKGFLYDAEGIYKYKRNGDFINRKRKSKGDVLQDQITRGEMPAAAADTTSSAQSTDFQTKKSQQIQELHDERVKTEQEQTKAINRLAEAQEEANRLKRIELSEATGKPIGKFSDEGTEV